MQYIQQFNEWNKQQAINRQPHQNNPFGQPQQQPVQPPFDPRRQDAEYMNHLDSILGNQAVRSYATNNEILNFAEGWANKVTNRDALGSLSEARR